MKKEAYTNTELEIIRFYTADVIATSNFDDEYEGWNPHNHQGGSGGSDYEGWNPH